MSAETLYEQDYLGWLEQQKSLLANQAWKQHSLRGPVRS